MAATMIPAAGPIERFLSLDDRGVGLRASWRPAHGFVNISLWRGDRCVEAFHLRPEEVARLTAFLATSLTDLVATPTPRPTPHLQPVDAAVGVSASGAGGEAPGLGRRLRRAAIAGAARVQARRRRA
jgi:hypothetical protein